MSPKCNEFQPQHINISSKDIEGNNGLGRYIFLPGSDGRAKSIAEYFGNLEVIPHPRSHNFYKGTLKTTVGEIDVASISSGMGCPSIDIIVNELYNLDARRLLRVGTAGSLQPQSLRVGHLVIPTASVRDEGTSPCYTPPEVPAVASTEIVSAIHQA